MALDNVNKKAGQNMLEDKETKAILVWEKRVHLKDLFLGLLS